MKNPVEYQILDDEVMSGVSFDSESNVLIPGCLPNGKAIEKF